MKKLTIFLLFILSSTLLCAAPPAAEEILARIDDNYIAETRMSEVTMIITERRGTRTLKARGWSKGIDQSFTEYLAPPRDAGTKMLKLKDELWIYSPQADRIIKIAGHMLRQSMMGSDMSYEDMMEDPVLTNTYDAEITGEEIVNSRNCYVLKLTAKTDDASYHFRKIWVDKVRYLPLREDRFAKSGKLLKVTNITEVFKTGVRWYPKRIVFKDALKTGAGTEIIIDSIAFNVKVPAYIFSKAALRK
ncbi:MAG: outer membrane lipoprotein-sorting protein [Candidatus Margulisiibacteriota bacterium]